MFTDRWIKKHFIIAGVVASFSKDTSTKCGAVIVRPDNSIASTGYNDFPRGVCDVGEVNERRRKRDDKYLYTEHAERNAIYNCNENMNGYSLFTYAYPRSLFICTGCARGIIQSGITDVWVHAPGEVDRWEEKANASKEMFRERGVNFHFPDIEIDLSEITSATENFLNCK